MVEVYKCGICGKEYDNIEDRINCETKCLAKRKEDEKEKKHLELEKKKEERLKELDEAYKNYTHIRNQYVKDYGGYYLNSITSGDWEDFWDNFRR